MAPALGADFEGLQEWPQPPLLAWLLSLLPRAPNQLVMPPKGGTKPFSCSLLKVQASAGYAPKY